MRKITATILLSMLLLASCGGKTTSSSEPTRNYLQMPQTTIAATTSVPEETESEPTKEPEDWGNAFEDTNPPEATESDDQPGDYYAPWKYDVVAKAKQDGKLHYYFMSAEGKTMISTATYPEKWGDCCLIVVPDGTTVMVDTGHTPYADILVQNLRQMGIQRIDYLLISHYHGDHLGGAVKSGGLLDSFAVGQVFITTAKDNITSGLKQKCKDLNIPLTALLQGAEKQLGSLQMRVLWPTNEYADVTTTDAAQINDTSLVVRFDYKGHSSLFPGDIYSGVEQTLATKYPALLSVDLLKAPHHGDSTSSLPVFAAAVSPKLVVSTGFAGLSKATQLTYETVGAQLLDDKNWGYIHVFVDGADIKWETSR